MTINKWMSQELEPIIDKAAKKQNQIDSPVCILTFYLFVFKLSASS